MVVLNANAQIKVQDDSGRLVILEKPATRVISLAPNITELLFSAGADEQVIGVVEFSDYPEKAKKIQRIGDFNKFDFESIISLKPDLIIAWKSGNPTGQVRRLMEFGFNVFVSEPESLEDVADNIKVIGRLMGTEEVANAEAKRYLTQLIKLKDKNRNKKKISVFYQVWNQPLMTINKKHIINDVINLCGGNNVFADLNVLSPNIDIESVILKNPQVIIAGMATGREQWLDEWKKWQGLDAVKHNHLYSIHADLITRHTPRILLGAKKMCEYFERVR